MEDRGALLPQDDLVEKDPSTEKMECDLELIICAKNGDKDAFSLLFMKTYRRMYFVAKSFLSNDEDIYDALQNGYMKAYKYIHRLDPPEKFLSWLIKIMQNAAKDVRGHAQEYAIGDEIQQIADTDVTSDAERRADMQDVLSQMDPKRAEVLIRYYYDGMKLGDIAKLLGEPASTVRSRFKAAKKEILTLLKTKDIDSSLYSGSISTMIALALRSVIGTDILSAVVAQQMLDGILDDGQLSKAAFRLVEQRRNKSVRHLATVMAVSCIIIAAIVAAVVTAVLMGRQRSTSSNGGAMPHASTSTDTSTTTEQFAVLPDRSTASRPTSTTTRAVMGPVLPPVWTTLPESVTTTTSTNRATAGTTAKTTTSTTRKVTAAPAGPFTPDYRVGHANTIGNNSNNICSNYGQIAKQDQWLYYAIDNVLYKVKTNGTGQRLVTECPERIWFVNVIGDWVYMLAGSYYYQCRTDGSLAQISYDMTTPFLQVIENTAYYGSGLRKWNMMSEGAAVTLAPGYYVDDFWMNQGYIVFPYADGEWIDPGKDCQMAILSLSTGKVVEIPVSFLTDYVMYGDVIYARNDNGFLVSVNYTSSNPKNTMKQLSTCGGLLRFAVDGVIGSAPALDYGYPEVVSTDGKFISNYWSMNPSVDLNNLCTFDDGYVYTFTEDGALCRAKPDGSDFERIT